MKNSEDQYKEWATSTKSELIERLGTWQPIETAPDSQSIDVWLTSKHNPQFGARVTDVHKVGNRWFGFPNWWSATDGVLPTHWMPLPAPPEST